MFGLELISFAIVLFELYLSSTWNAFYFRHGILVYRKSYSLKKDVNIQAQNITQRRIGDDFEIDLIFHDIGENEVAFREEVKFGRAGLRYTPVMHGLIRRTAEPDGVEVIGFLNWSVLGILLFAAARLISIFPCLFIFLILLAIIIYVIYRIQVQRFDDLGAVFE